MKNIKRMFTIFHTEGEVNDVLNTFANFIYFRKEDEEATEKELVQKLQNLCGCTNSPLSLLDKRILDREVYFETISEYMGRQVLQEMRWIINKHSK